MGGVSYRDLVVWQKGVELVEAVYSLTAGFPKEEVYTLTSQMRRSAISVPSNIAEGQGRRSPGEFRRLLLTAHGSLRELETQAIIAQRLAYLSLNEASRLHAMTGEIGRLLNGLIRSQKAVP